MAKKTRILLFDDDRDSLTIYTHVFAKKGYEVFTRAHCLDCLEVTGFFQPDIIFIDHNMPGKTGYQAVVALKSHPEFKHIPIVYFSSSDEIAKLAKRSGADAYLQKPCNIQAFEQAIIENLHH